MKYIIIWLFLPIFALGALSCGGKSTTVGDSSNKEVACSKFAKIYPEFNTETLNKVFGNKVLSDSTLKSIYVHSEYRPIWAHDTLNTSKLHSLIDILNNAHIEHGLSPNIFNVSAISLMSDSIDSGAFADSIDILYQKISTLEQISTNAVLKYVIGMNYGFSDPKTLFKRDYHIEVQKPDTSFYNRVYAEISADPIAALINSQPTSDVYKKMQSTNKDFENIKNTKLPKIESKGANFAYKIGDKNKNISAIADRLNVLTGYKPDSVYNDSIPLKLDKDLLAAVNDFRHRISYPEDDKEIGGLTIEALNRPVDYYQKKIRANMERHRWKRAKPQGVKNVEVNVAAFKLVATQPDTVPLIMRVCVGSISNKTPLMESDFDYLNLNPVWNVPTSIARKEISVKQKRDPSYIKRQNMKLYKGGKEVDPSTIDWQSVDPSKFGYTVRQSSGGGNSLGRVKFMFKNDFSVYLHDTPSQAAFGRKNRAVSHGCVRLHQPIDFTYFLLSPITDEYKDQILYSISRAPETATGKKLLKENKLKKVSDIISVNSQKISLYIDYHTVYMTPSDSRLLYADDVYNYDDIILKAIDTLI